MPPPDAKARPRTLLPVTLAPSTSRLARTPGKLPSEIGKFPSAYAPFFMSLCLDARATATFATLDACPLRALTNRPDSQTARQEYAASRFWPYRCHAMLEHLERACTTFCGSSSDTSPLVHTASSSKIRCPMAGGVKRAHAGSVRTSRKGNGGTLTMPPYTAVRAFRKARRIDHVTLLVDIGARHAHLIAIGTGWPDRAREPPR